MERILSVLAVLFILSSCKKDKVPVPILEEPSKWEVIAGNYKVYDTLGTYLYDMKIVHVPNEQESTVDSLRFENFDGEFTFTWKQPTASNLPNLYMVFGYHDTLYDSQSKRWKILFDDTDPVYNNVLVDDTIRMNFGKTNINYYIEDLTPYFQCDCIQVAVKQ